jgi:hypothetical protein
VIVLRPPDGTLKEIAPIAAAEIEHHRCITAKERWPVEAPFFRQFLQRGLGPQRGIEDLARDRHAELALDAPAFLFFHAGILPGETRLRMARRTPQAHFRVRDD